MPALPIRIGVDRTFVVSSEWSYSHLRRYGCGGDDDEDSVHTLQTPPDPWSVSRASINKAVAA